MNFWYEKRADIKSTLLTTNLSQKGTKETNNEFKTNSYYHKRKEGTTMSIRHEYWLEPTDNDLEVAGYCDSCDSEVLVGDKLFESDTEFLCMDCVQTNAFELLEDYLSGNFVTAEAF